MSWENADADFDSSKTITDVKPIEPSTIQKVETVKALAIDPKTQAIVASDNSELLRMIKIMMKGQAFPKSFDTEAKVIAGWQVAAALKVPPAIAIQNMAFINGSICLWGQLPKALAEATGELEDFKLILINKDQKQISLENQNLHEDVWGAVCQITRKGRSMNEYTFTMTDAQRAALIGKAGPWREYTKIMLSRRAVSHAIKFEFPDSLMGVPIAEYDFNEAPDLKDVTPPHSREAAKEKMNSILKGET